jgi:miniconductance mechanosensitive channel
MLDTLRDWLGHLGLSELQVSLAAIAVASLVLALIAFVANFVAKRIILRAVASVVKRTRTDWDDALAGRRFFTRFSHLAPALVIWGLAPLAFPDAPGLIAAARQLAELYMLLVGLLVADAFLDAVLDIYRKFEVSQRIPIKGYLQVVKIVLAIAAGIFALSITLDKSPWVFLSGLGAVTAILLLIFKDAILGLVAGIQLAGNDMVRPGDWIEMPKYGADGDVMEISLTTVKVRNWDKTVTTIPTYALISDAFRNWRGMSESGGRRIKRAIHIDVTSIRFCNAEMIERFRGIHLLGDYIRRKEEELADYNREHGVDDASLVNGRRMTNIGTFRAYLVAYLRQHPRIHKEMTFLVRQLQPTEKGLPIEIYVFSADQAWVNYEAIQSDIFDHVFASLPEFELRPFQAPTGADIAATVGSLGAAS